MKDNKKTVAAIAASLLERQMKTYERVQRFLHSRFMRYLVFLAIIGSVMSVILGSFEELSTYHGLLYSVTYITSLIFFIEYVLQIYAAPAENRKHGRWIARLRYMFSFYGAVDFISLLPFILTYKYWNTELMHFIILPYIFTVFKIIRYSRSMRLIMDVVKAVKAELVTACTACGIIVCFSAILMYYLERKAQPEVFENIGDSFWWAIITFTTVGYGDIYPVTGLGRLLSSFISLIGIAMIAIPTGIISSAFINVMNQDRNKNKSDEEC